jgi:uracil-DNA glycosylase
LLNGAEVVVCLGATAPQALIGKNFRVTQQRGEMRSEKDCAAAPAVML